MSNRYSKKPHLLTQPDGDCVTAIRIGVEEGVVKPICIHVPALRIYDVKRSASYRIRTGEPSLCTAVVPRPEEIEARLVIPFFAGKHSVTDRAR